jgi:glucose-6-phosphate isomerase
MTRAASSLAGDVERRLERIARDRIVSRLWQRDPTVWVANPETPEVADRLGWLTVADGMREHLADLTAFAQSARRAFDRVVLLGMGGSSLAPEVLWRAFGPRPGWPAFLMLDSTDPRAVRGARDAGDLTRTLFIVASKSGTTIETSSFERYFWEVAGRRAEQFVAITDPGTELDRRAVERGYRRVFRNPADVGGRYSALSFFGLVPAALMGIEVGALLERAVAMMARCRLEGSGDENPGVALGAALGEAALRGRDKLTLVLAPEIGAFGLWVEQLVAESTGKRGKGIVPVMEPWLAEPERYGGDRHFVWVDAEWSPRSRAVLTSRLDALEAAGHPVTRFELHEPADLAAEFFRWEIGTAIAAHVMELNPYDQPNVAESKAITRRVLAEGPTAGRIPRPRRQQVSAFLTGVKAGDYVAVLAYAPPAPETDRVVEEFVQELRDRLDVPVTWGYGPRYLHSTGQLHKGGPQTGHFVEVVEVAPGDEPIPGEEYTFGQLIWAQARGDSEALVMRGRPVLRIAAPREFVELA